MSWRGPDYSIYAAIPRRFRDAVASRIHQPARSAIVDFTDNVRDRLQHGHGLFIIGSFGVGKSAAAGVAARSAIDAGAVLFWKQAHELQSSDFRTRTKGAFDLPPHAGLIDRLPREVDLLVIDHLGCEYVEHPWFPGETGLDRRWLEPLLAHRNETGGTTIVTTYLPLAEIKARYGDALWETIERSMQVVVIVGESQRRPHPGW